MKHDQITPPLENRANSKTILLVEDEALIAIYEKALLQKHGFQVIMAASGAAAVDIARRTPELDLILMDINLGADLDGTEAAQQILARRDVPILFLSSHTDPEVVAKTEKITSYGYVVKNSGETVLLASIKMAFKLFAAHQRLKQQEAALRESEEHFRAIADYTYDWESWHGTDGQVCWVNPMVAQHTGYSVAECLAMPNYPLPIIAPEEREQIGTLLQAAIRERTSGNDVSFRFRRKDQTSGWMAISWQPVYNSHGRYLGIRSSMRNIIDCKRAEEALRESENRYRHLIESARDVIYTISMDGIITSVNCAFETISGWSSAEMVGTHLTAIVHPDDWPLALEMFQRMSQGELPPAHEVRVRSKPGDYWIGEFTMTPHIRDGRIIGILGIGRNITDHKQVEEALRENEANLSALLENADGSIWSVDGEYRMLVGNARFRQNFERVLGRKPQQGDGILVETLPQEFLAQWREYYDRALRGEAFSVETLTRFLQEPRYMEYRFRPIRTSDGAIIGVTVAGRDITERKQAEEMLRMSDQRYRKAQEIGHVGNWAYNLQTNRFWGSDEAKRIYGFDPEQADFSTDEVERCLPERERVHQALLDLITEGKEYHLEFEIHPRNSDEPRIIASVAELQHDENGDPLSVLGVIQDITARKRAEEALRESEEKWRSLVTTTPDFIALHDREGKFLFLNHYAKGFAENEVIGTSAYDYLAPESRELFKRKLEECVMTQTRQKFEYTAFGDDATLRVYEQYFVPLLGKNNEPIIMAVARDMTDRKRMEEALRESERQLRKLNASKDKFFSILAHDLKNPLVSFLSFAQLLEEEFEGMSPAERARLIRLFRASAEALFALLENLLTWSKLQRGLMDYCPQPLVLKWIAARNVELCAPQAAQKQITLTQAVPAVEVQGDLHMVDAVVRNLLSNAIKFTPPGGAVDITATPAAHDVRIAVADTGIGIPPEKVAQLFQIDAKTHRTGTAGEKGTGLGLILCKEFVEKNGGQLWVESAVGKGTTVTFTLPTSPLPTSPLLSPERGGGTGMGFSP